MFEDWHTVQTLLMTYADRVDSGRFAEAAALFDNATYRLEFPDRPGVTTYQGAEEVYTFFAGTRLYSDGTPRTKHLITNVTIDLDGYRANSRCNVTVLQQTDALALQPIASGRYLDSFERAGGEWRFADRLVTGFLLGDLSQHVYWYEDLTDESVS
jgi:3-phenylpropionate/cinnamic acid dioxygenase small subunit